ncbi:pyridoxine/pyridoxamine 5'-phosphate oxidase [Drosophila busckii]|nr:pyridoxine/pyridoxamine 5'-phosphate oxidase [Drosophila busckii]
MTSSMAFIANAPAEPALLLQQLLDGAQRSKSELQSMNLATLDAEFGVLNRTVLYRGLSADNCIVYITQRYTRNYKNIAANPKCGVTIYLPHVSLGQAEPPATWQVRLIGATAVELPDAELDAWWAKESLAAQIRNLIFPCGQPIDYEQQKQKHDAYLQKFLEDKQPLQRPPTYTAFKFKAQAWDFLKVGENQIADRLQYRQLATATGQWQSLHVST